MATNPQSKPGLVSGSHFIAGGVVKCNAYRSTDGGDSWTFAATMIQLTPGSQCSDSVVQYSPDGSRVYFAYMDIKDDDFDILVSYSDDNGATWHGPFVALKGVSGAFSYDKPWIGAPLDDSRYLYVTATRFDDGPGPCHIAFSRSTNANSESPTFEPPKILDSSGGPCGLGPSPVVQGSRPSGGKNGALIVAWYNSGDDGWLLNSFQIRSAYSADYGATFAPISVAATDTSEAPFYLGPTHCSERWWGAAMFPDVEIDSNGSANIVYAHDPTFNPTPTDPDAESGDIRYVTSATAPYTAWSAPITVNDNGQGAQGMAALDTQTQGTGQSATLHAQWLDTRLSAGEGGPPQCAGDPGAQNLHYDMFYSQKPYGQGWKPNVRMSDTSSVSDFMFLGDYTDLSVSNGSLFGVWTDRRRQVSIFNRQDDIWGSRVIVTSGTP